MAWIHRSRRSFSKRGMATEILKNLNHWGFSGKLFAVNPRYEQIGALPCFPSLTAIPHPVDLALVGIPGVGIPAVLGDCEAAGVGAIQIISNGFADQGTEGAARQARLVEWSRRTSIPVAGPNCLGLLNAANGLIAMAATYHTMKAGGISAVLQSGMVVCSLVPPPLARGIGIGRVVTVGNEACLDAGGL
ncbi:CoA-binding protein [Bradyrhizobium sp. BR 1432]|uniref:CoA-binding protein n=1 Tax=Bradyrhizobium sp. BR 1432 TaxID=3447966 RepID=UPI003EE6F9E9